MRRQHGARRASRIGWSERAARPEDVDRGAKAAGEHELGQRVEVDDVRAAHEDEHRVGPDELEQLAREQRLDSRCVGVASTKITRESSRSRSRLARLDTLLPQVGVGQPGVVRADIAAERLEKRAQPPADRFRSRRTRRAFRRAGTCRGRRRRSASARRVTAWRGRPPRCRGSQASASPSAISATASGEGGRRREHADPALEAAPVVELRRPSARDRQDRAQALGLVQHGAVAPAAAHDRERVGQRHAKASAGIGSSRPQTTSTVVGEPLASSTEKTSRIARKWGSTMTRGRSVMA